MKNVSFAAIKTLHWKFLSSVLPILVFLSVTIFSVSEYLSFKRLDSAFQREVELLTRTHANQISSALWNYDSAGVEISLDAIIARADVTFAQVIGDNGQRFAARGQDTEISPGDFVHSADIKITPDYGQEHNIGRLVVVGTREHLKETFARRAAANATVLIILVITLSAAIVFITRRDIRRPLKSLNHAISRATKKQLQGPIATTGTHEIDSVINSFEEMLASQQSYEKRLHELHSELESKVEDRTRELLNAHRQLESRVQERTQALTKEVAERKRTEAQLLKAKDEAEAANKSKSQFLANMSHEIRTPMNGVVGMIDVLERMDMKPEHHRIIQTIRRSSFSLLRIIDDILDASKIEAGKLELENVAVQLHKTIENAVETLIPVADAAQVQLSLYIDSQVPTWVMSDEGRLRQIVLNLLGNAIKFSKRTNVDETGQAGIDLACMPDGSLQIRVTDNGIGMSAKVLSTIFKAFSQGEESTTRVFGGTGLGLTISSNLVNLMGGSISVDSLPGKGTTFVVELPLEKADIEDVKPDLSHLKLLALFDDLLAAEEFNSYVCSIGATIQFASTESDLASRLVIDDDAMVVLAKSTGADNERLKVALADGAGRRNFLSFTDNRADKLGLLSPNHYVVLSSPVLPSHVEDGLKALEKQQGNEAGKRSDQSKVCAIDPRIVSEEAGDRLVLLVEDNIVNQEVMEYQLGVLGFAVEFANTGLEGFELWKTGRFDLVLTDCHMPEMDGFEMTSRIRQAEKDGGLTRIPIVAVTANALKGEAERCFAAGLDDYLSKPVQLAQLKQALIRWCPV